MHCFVAFSPILPARLHQCLRSLVSVWSTNLNCLLRPQPLAMFSCNNRDVLLIKGELVRRLCPAGVIASVGQHLGAAPREGDFEQCMGDLSWDSGRYERALAWTTPTSL